MDVEVGDGVAVHPPCAASYLAEVIYAEGGARFSDQNFLQVVREDDCAVISIVLRDKSILVVEVMRQ